MVLEKELLESWILICRRREVVWDTGYGLSIYETSKLDLTVIHFLQQGCTYSNKATTLNNATAFGGHFLSYNHRVLIRIIYWDLMQVITAMSSRVQQQSCLEVSIWHQGLTQARQMNSYWPKTQPISIVFNKGFLLWLRIPLLPGVLTRIYIAV